MARVRVGVVEIDACQRDLRVCIVACGVLDDQVPALRGYAGADIWRGNPLGDPALPISRERSKVILDWAAGLATTAMDLSRMRGVGSEAVEVKSDGERVVAGSPCQCDAAGRCVRELGKSAFECRRWITQIIRSRASLRHSMGAITAPTGDDERNQYQQEDKRTHAAHGGPSLARWLHLLIIHMAYAWHTHGIRMAYAWPGHRHGT